MGQMKRWMEEMYDSQNESLAEVLNVTPEELYETEYEIDEDRSDDGVLYQYVVRFPDGVPSSFLDQSERLEDDGAFGYHAYLDPWELNDDYEYIEIYESSLADSRHYGKFQREIWNLRSLSRVNVEWPERKQTLSRLIFTGVISAMETYLSDVFIHHIENSENMFQQFLKTHPNFNKRKFLLKDIYEELAHLETTARKAILDTMFHNLPKVQHLYQDTFGIKFPMFRDAYRLVLIRHDLVHRSGKTKNGELIALTDGDIEHLFTTIDEFVLGVEEAVLVIKVENTAEPEISGEG